MKNVKNVGEVDFPKSPGDFAKTCWYVVDCTNIYQLVKLKFTLHQRCCENCATKGDFVAAAALSLMQFINSNFLQALP